VVIGQDARYKSAEFSRDTAAVMTGAGLRAALLPGPAAAQAYPVKPVKIVVPAQPGGGLDLVGRTVADQLGRALSQSFIVENVSGGGGLIATQAVARAARRHTGSTHALAVLIDLDDGADRIDLGPEPTVGRAGVERIRDRGGGRRPGSRPGQGDAQRRQGRDDRRDAPGRPETGRNGHVAPERTPTTLRAMRPIPVAVPGRDGDSRNENSRHVRCEMPRTPLSPTT
jgi:hypothetical protein